MSANHDTAGRPLLATAADVYRGLRDEGLMLRGNGTGRDDALWESLVRALGFAPPVADLPGELERSSVSVEQFVRAFLTCLEPFAAMMAEVCAFMQQAQAADSYRGLAISYRFSDDDAVVSVDLEHFRKYWRTYLELYKRSVLRIWSACDVEQYVGDLEQHSESLRDGRHTVPDDARMPGWDPGEEIPEDWQQDGVVYSHALQVRSLLEAVEQSLSDGRVESQPDSLFGRPSASNDDGEVEGVDAAVRDILRHQELFAPCPLSAEKLAELRDLLAAAHGHLTAAARLRSADPQPQPQFGEEYSYRGPNSLEQILDHYRDLPTQERRTSSLVESLREILDLPSWRHRWQLYQVWVGMSVLDMLRARGLNPSVHAPGGKLELYEHYPAHLAEIPDCRDSVSFWAELQTVVPGEDGEKGETRSIRPDYRLARAPVTNAERALAIVEAKQRLGMTARDLETLCQRYRSGCPNGLLLFVNYDVFPECEDLAARTGACLVSEYRPGKNRSKGTVINEVGKVAAVIRSEQQQVADERTAKGKQELAAIGDEIARLIDGAESSLRGLRFLGSFHHHHADDRVGAIVLDYRRGARSLPAQGGDAFRTSVVQYARANPLAQVWLAGTTREPILGYHFDYVKDRSNLAYEECDLPKLVRSLGEQVQGSIVVLGYGSDLRFATSSRVILQTYVD